MLLARATKGENAKANAIKCASNLKQLQLGWHLYALDNNDAMTPNAPLGANLTNSWCPGSYMNWTTSDTKHQPGPVPNCAHGRLYGRVKSAFTNVPRTLRRRIMVCACAPIR